MTPDRTGENEPPPFLGTWNRVYGMVAIYLGVVIAALYALSER